MKVRIDGKQFALGGDRFPVNGVTYGTFAPREDGARFPERGQVKRDFASMADAGFTVVRTYTPPPEDVVDIAADFGLRILAGVFFPDWRYLLGADRRGRRRVAGAARAAVRESARRLAGHDHVLALCIGNEIPADVIRWHGTTRIERALAELVDVVRDEDTDQLVTYANYPTSEYLRLDSVDFLTVNVFLERQPHLRRYLTRLHHLAGDRPLVIGELGLHAGEGTAGEARQAEVLDWQLQTLVERGVAGRCIFSWTDEWHVGDHAVEGWRFGLTRHDRSPRPALAVARRWNRRTVADLDHAWPSLSVVVCAYNAEATIDECLRHTCALDYPGLDVVVIDDGSTDATADIVRRHPRARLVSIPHAGLSAARNEGCRAAEGDLVAYLDSDAYPTPEWPYFLALGLDGPTVGGIGGPNVPPGGDGLAAQRVARAPGGPVHVLTADDRAEHVPGCNMAFWKPVIEEVGGFDPVFTSAGDDVDVCWKVLDRGWEIGFHPAALVWHHRRGSTRAYLRQQSGYGRSEALVALRHPDRFTSFGTARWHGRVYDSVGSVLSTQRIYRGLHGAASYQSVYGGGGHALDIAHQLGVPLAAVALAVAPVAWLFPALAVVPLAAVTLLVVLGALDAVAVRPPRGLRRPALRFRLGVAALHLLQPLVRTWGRLRHLPTARRQLPPGEPIPGPLTRPARRVYLLPESAPRAQLAPRLVDALRRGGVHSAAPGGWEDYDARLQASVLLAGDLVTSAHPEGWIQIRVRRRARPRRMAAAAIAALVGTVVFPPAGLVVVALTVADLGRGWWRTGPLVARLLGEATT